MCRAFGVHFFWLTLYTFCLKYRHLSTVIFLNNTNKSNPVFRVTIAPKTKTQTPPLFGWHMGTTLFSAVASIQIYFEGVKFWKLRPEGSKPEARRVETRGPKGRERG